MGRQRNAENPSKPTRRQIEALVFFHLVGPSIRPLTTQAGSSLPKYLPLTIVRFRRVILKHYLTGEPQSGSELQLKEGRA